MPRPRRNPFLSLWLSAANRVAGAARGLATAAVRRQQRAGAKAIAETWTGGAAKRPRRPKG